MTVWDECRLVAKINFRKKTPIVDQELGALFMTKN